MTLPTTNPVLAWPNLDTPQYGAVNTRTKTLYTPSSSGGSWSSATPLTNLVLPQRYQRVVRSSSTAVADTQIVTDFGRLVPASVFALPGHNMTPNVGWSQWRVRFATTNSFPANLVANPDDAGAAGWGNNGVAAITRNAATINGRNFFRIGAPAAGDSYTDFTLTGNGIKRWELDVVCDGGATGHGNILFNDETASASRCFVTYTVTAGTLAITAVASTGTVVSVTSMGSGVYRIVANTTSCIAANRNVLYASYSGGSPAPTVSSILMSRARVEDMPATVVIDSGFISAFQPAHDALSFPFGVPVDSTTAPTLDDLLGSVVSSVYVNSTVQQGRYRKIEIDDITNTDGYIELTPFMGPGYFLPVAPNIGMALSWKEGTTLEVSPFGIRRYNQQGRWRECQLSQGMLTEGRGIWPFRMEGRQGISQEMFFSLYPGDPNYVNDWSFLCTLSELSGISWAAAKYLNKDLKLVEKI